MAVGEKIREGGLILSALGVIGFIGVIWLMIFGNLSGNLGFGQDSLPFSNETIVLNDAGATPSTAQGRVNGALSNVVITNATGGEIIASGNYTITGVVITNATGTYGGQNVNVSATVTFDEAGKVNTDGVINNITGGFNTFFTFSNTFFTIAAIVLLIFMLVGLLAIVMTIAAGRSGKKGSGFSGN